MSKLTDSEIQNLFQKIRSEYKSYALENPNIFKILPFEERYSEVLKNRGNIESFLKDELLFFEQLKKKHKELLEKKEASKGETFHKIIEEQELKIQKYPKLEFHPDSKNELKFFFGAIKDFVEIEINLILQIYRGTLEMNQIQEPIIQLERIGLSKKGILPIRMSEHIKLLSVSNQSYAKIEQDSQSIMKEGCLALKRLNSSLTESLAKKKINFKLNFKFHDTLEPSLYKRFQGKSFESIIPEIQNRIVEIIKDFRMDGILGI